MSLTSPETAATMARRSVASRARAASVQCMQGWVSRSHSWMAQKYRIRKTTTPTATEFPEPSRWRRGRRRQGRSEGPSAAGTCTGGCGSATRRRVRTKHVVVEADAQVVVVRVDEHEGLLRGRAVAVELQHRLAGEVDPRGRRGGQLPQTVVPVEAATEGEELPVGREQVGPAVGVAPVHA